jgi:hypothetical protein
MEARAAVNNIDRNYVGAVFTPLERPAAGVFRYAECRLQTVAGGRLVLLGRLRSGTPDVRNPIDLATTDFVYEGSKVPGVELAKLLGLVGAVADPPQLAASLRAGAPGQWTESRAADGEAPK